MSSRTALGDEPQNIDALIRADRAGQRFDAAVGCLPASAGFEHMQLMREAVASVRLEGFEVTLSGVVGQGLANEPTVPEGVSAARSLQAALAAARSDSAQEGLDGARLARLHCAMRGLTGELPSPDAALQSALGQLARDLAGTGGRPHLVRVAVMQGRILQLRPFGSAPGPLARLLALDAMRWMAVPGHRGLALSVPVLRRLEEYRYRLARISKGSGWDGWVGFCANCFAEAAASGEQTLRRFSALREEQRTAISAGLGHSASRGLTVLDRLYERPLTSVADVRSLTGTSYVAANLLVARLVDLGILEEATGFKRNRHFRNGACLALFEKEPAGVKVPERGLVPPQPSISVSVPSASARQALPRRADAGPPARRAPGGPLDDHLL